jgi:4-hydroxyphenylpyruvate dioxygenase
MSDRGPAHELVLYAGCLPAVPFRQFVDAAASASFTAVTLWPLMYRRALSREGLTPADMRAAADDASVGVSCLEGCGDWLPLSGEAPRNNIFRVEWSRDDFFRVALELGADTVVASDMTGGAFTHQQAVDGFGRLCEDAAQHGLQVALEFISFSGIPDVASAWDIVRDAAAPNARLVFDVCHYRRGGSSAEQLALVPPHLISDVQVADGAAVAPPDLMDEAMFHRALPGHGAFGVAEVMRSLTAAGVSARVGPELYLAEGTDAPGPTAVELMNATTAVLS